MEQNTNSFINHTSVCLKLCHYGCCGKGPKSMLPASRACNCINDKLMTRKLRHDDTELNIMSLIDHVYRHTIFMVFIRVFEYSSNAVIM